MIALDTIVVHEEREGVHGLKGQLHIAVLHLASIAALIVVVYLLLVFHHNLVIFVGVHLATFAHLLALVLAPARLDALMLVHLRFHDTKLVELRLGGEAETTIAVSAA